jgi:hypothetical protein
MTHGGDSNLGGSWLFLAAEKAETSRRDAGQPDRLQPRCLDPGAREARARRGGNRPR